MHLHISQELVQLESCPCHDSCLPIASLLMLHVHLGVLTHQSLMCRRAAQQPAHEMVSPVLLICSTFADLVMCRRVACFYSRWQYEIARAMMHPSKHNVGSHNRHLNNAPG